MNRGNPSQTRIDGATNHAPCSRQGNKGKKNDRPLFRLLSKRGMCPWRSNSRALHSITKPPSNNQGLQSPQLINR